MARTLSDTEESVWQLLLDFVAAASGAMFSVLLSFLHFDTTVESVIDGRNCDGTAVLLNLRQHSDASKCLKQDVRGTK